MSTFVAIFQQEGIVELLRRMYEDLKALGEFFYALLLVNIAPILSIHKYSAQINIKC